MSLTVASQNARVTNVTLTDLVNNLGQTNSKYDDKSVRVLFANKNSNNETATFKVHTSTSKLFGGSAARDEKRLGARQNVKEALMREYQIDGNKADALMSKACKRSDRISLGELKKLQQLAMADKFVVNMSTKTRMSADFLGQIQANRIPLKDTPTIKSIIDEAKNAQSTKDFKVALGKLEELRLIASQQGKWNEIIPPSNDFRKNVGNPLKADILNQIDTICEEVTIERTSNELANSNLGLFTGDALHVSNQERIDFRDGTIDDLIQFRDCWKPSKHGANGGVIIENEGIPGGGAILKFEKATNVEACNKISECISHVTSQITLPIDSMMIRSLDIAPDKCDQISQILESKRDPHNTHNVNTANSRLKSIKENAEFKETPMKAMFVKGSTDFSSMSTGARVQLIRTPQLPQSFGSAMILAKLFGLGDHIGIEGQQIEGDTNLSNMMFNPTTGRIALIDFAHFKGGRANDQCGTSDQGIKDGFTSLANNIKDIAQNPGLLNRSLNLQLLKQGELTSPFGKLFQAVFCPALEGTLFNYSEQSALTFVTEKDRKAFALNTFIGVIDTLSLIANNQGVFGHQSAMLDNPQQVMQDISNIVQGLNGVRQQLENQLSDL